MLSVPLVLLLALPVAAHTRKPRHPPVSPDAPRAVVTPAPVDAPTLEGGSAQPSSEPTGGNADLTRAERLFEEAQYYEAIAALDDIVNRKGLPAYQIREARIYLGMANMAVGNEAATRTQFRLVLTAYPDYVAPIHSSPKIRKIIESVRYEVKMLSLIEPQPPLVTTRADGNFNVRLRFLAKDLGDKVPELFWRVRGGGAYATSPLVGTHDMVSDLNVPIARGASGSELGIEYYLELHDAYSMVSLGNKLDPLTLRVQVDISEALLAQARANPPVYKKWWLWTAVGAVVAGGVVATYFILNDTSKATTGAINLQVGSAASR